jgi:hypothetical protein
MTTQPESICGYDADGRPLRREVSKRCDQAGAELRALTKDADGQVLQENVVRWDAQGRHREIIWRTGEGELIERQSYAYSEDRKTMYFIRVDGDGKIIEEWSRTEAP